MDVSENSGTPKSSILIGFSIIFTIHFGGFPHFWFNTHISYDNNPSALWQCQELTHLQQLLRSLREAFVRGASSRNFSNTLENQHS